ncbi:MAG TPA: glycosyltransferase family 1 protein [Terriglobales bacterium]|nr:glycosyltransferase family 1 protein [Terriglobales bacterium]
MRILLNTVAATAGGGLTYLKHAVPSLASVPGIRLSVLVPPGLQEIPEMSDVIWVKFPANRGSAARFWREQRAIPQIISRLGIDVLISAGNFALKNSPVPQILLSRNALYTSGDFCRDLLRRQHYAIWLDTKVKGALAKRSIRWADVTVAPSAAFASDLRAQTGRDVIAIHHGFDLDQFTSRTKPLSASVQKELDAAQDCVRLLLVSHYNYYRNFETLLRGLALLKRQAPEKKFKLFLTCKFCSSENPGAYRAEGAATLVRSLGVREEVVELGMIPREQLPDLYRSCHLYVTAAYAESFAHPLVEAMASGLPIVASDIGVHREICAESAVFFNRFSAEELAVGVLKVMQERGRYEELSTRARARSREFSWAKHAREVVYLAQCLLEGQNCRAHCA